MKVTASSLSQLDYDELQTYSLNDLVYLELLESIYSSSIINEKKILSKAFWECDVDEAKHSRERANLENKT